jgi:putative tryptophan/tyrosine transport system substrate-binding protein
MSQKIGIFVLAVVLASSYLAQAQQAKRYRVGVILQGGPYYDAIDGLRDGLRELGFEEGKHFVLEIRDTKGDLKAVEEAARNLERDKVSLIYAVATSVTIAVKRGTSDVPIVFYVGSDPVVLGLVESFAKPGGRLTGVHYLTTDLTAKRLEILKEILPKGHRVLTFYDPNNRSAQEAAREGREAARHLGLKFVERHAASVEELQAALRALRAGEADAYFLVSDAMTIGQAQLITDTARAKRLATMFHEGSLVTKGGLASYGISYREAGRSSAKYIQRILTGTRPQDLPVETVHKLDLVLNLRTAREIGLTIPSGVLMRADKVIK